MRPPSPRSLRCAVIPFGSQANGQHHSASDTDAAVITLTETWAGPAAADAVQRRFDRFKQYPRHRLTKRPGGLDSAGASHTTPFFEFHHDHNPDATDPDPEDCGHAIIFAGTHRELHIAATHLGALHLDNTPHPYNGVRARTVPGELQVCRISGSPGNPNYQHGYYRIP